MPLLTDAAAATLPLFAISPAFRHAVDADDFAAVSCCFDAAATPCCFFAMLLSLRCCFSPPLIIVDTRHRAAAACICRAFAFAAADFAAFIDAAMLMPHCCHFQLMPCCRCHYCHAAAASFAMLPPFLRCAAQRARAFTLLMLFAMLALLRYYAIHAILMLLMLP